MVRENQIVVQPDEEQFVCTACDGRTFNAKEYLLQHCRTAKAHRREWCDSCEWLFVSACALDAHRRDSPRHWICPICELDKDDEGELESHMAADHSYCYRCQMKYADRNGHRVQHHNGCDQCDEYFSTVNQLLMVSRA